MQAHAAMLNLLKNGTDIPDADSLSPREALRVGEQMLADAYELMHTAERYAEAKIAMNEKWSRTSRQWSSAHSRMARSEIAGSAKAFYEILQNMVDALRIELGEQGN